MTDRRVLAGAALAFAFLFGGCDSAASVPFEQLGLVTAPAEGFTFCCDGSDESPPVVVEVELAPSGLGLGALATTMGLTIGNVSPAGALRFRVDGDPFDPDIDGFEFTEGGTVEVEVVVVACTIDSAEFDIQLTRFEVDEFGDERLLRPLETATERQKLVLDCPEPPPGGGTGAALTIQFAGGGEGQVEASWTSGGSRTITETSVIQIPRGDSVKLDATAFTPYYFSHWVGADDTGGTGGSTAFLGPMTGDRTVSVYFE